jgi:hypothetical protein
MRPGGGQCSKSLQHYNPRASDGDSRADIVASCDRKKLVQQPLRRAIIMIAIASVATVPVLMVAHFSEVIVWSLAYDLVNATPAGADPIYFAFVNYTTLGYGDLTPVEHWRLLGPITAMNGVLLFNWSLRC